MDTKSIEVVRRLLAVLLLSALVLVPIRTASASASAAVSWTDGNGLHVVSATQVDDRVWKLVVSTPNLSQPVRVDVLLPVGYADSTRRYPTLYLFHGTSGGADDWLDEGDAEAATAAYPMIVVMPDMGYDGNGGSWFTDWVDQQTLLGVANWESFHIRQLVPYVDAHLRTVDDRSGRAIAGLSQGGFGSMSYAARHPDLFVSVAGFSPAPDIFRNPTARVAGVALVSGIVSGLDGVEPFAPFGDPSTHALTWEGHNPGSLVTNLAHMDVDLWTGNGVPGPYDSVTPSPSTDAIELLVNQSSHYFAEEAQQDGVPISLVDYGPGTHTWPYWTRDLRAYLPHLRQLFAAHVPDPRRIGYRSTSSAWRQWGWRVVSTGAPGWTGLSTAFRHGFTFAGDSAKVTTPRFYRPGKRYTVTWQKGSGPTVVRATRAGRLELHVTGDHGVAKTRIRAAA